MRLYAIITSERLSRPARKGAEQELTVILSEGNRPVARIFQRPGKIEINFADGHGSRKIIINVKRLEAAESIKKV